MKKILPYLGWPLLLGLLAYQTVQVRQVRADAAEVRAARDSTAESTARQIEELGRKLERQTAEIQRLEYRTVQLIEQREADQETTDEKLDRLREEVPERVLPLVLSLEHQIEVERARADEIIAAKDSIIAVERDRTAAERAKYELAIAAATAERRLSDKLQEQVDAQARSSLPFGIGVSDAVAAGVGLLAGLAIK